MKKRCVLGNFHSYTSLFIVALLLISCDEDPDETSLEQAKDVLIGIWERDDADVGHVEYTFENDSILTVSSDAGIFRTYYWLHDPPEDKDNVSWMLVLLLSDGDYIYGGEFYVTRLNFTSLHLASFCEGSRCITDQKFRRK